MHSFHPEELTKYIGTKRGVFDSSCKLLITDEALFSLKKNRLKISLLKPAKQTQVSNLEVVIKPVVTNISLKVGSNNATIILEENITGRFDIRTWLNSHVHIGEGTSAGEAIIVCKNSGFICGKDCMFSTEVLIQSSDQHGIVDLKTGEIINSAKTQVVIGDHVWLGRRSTLTPNAKVGDGSIIASQAVVTNSIPSMTIAAGIPAKVIKEGKTWSRSSFVLDEYSQNYVTDYQ